MKHIARVVTFAAALAASTLAQSQQPAPAVQDPTQELAAVIAVEEQERDLAKAETIYREVLAGTKLSAAARAMANGRLGRMLQKLGREAEAKPLLEAANTNAGFDDFGAVPQPQDVEREKALREKAKGLVQQVLDDRNPSQVDPGSRLHGIRSQVAEQLLWIGQPAVPVVIAALEDLAKAKSYDPTVIAGLAGFLWRTGGPQAAEFLKTCAKQGTPAMRGNVVRTAYQANRPEMLATVEAFLDDSDPEITFAMLQCRDQDEMELAYRLNSAVILAMAERGTPAHKVFVLTWAGRLADRDPAIARRIVALVRAGFASTDPAVGAAARKCLETAVVPSCVEGVELLLGEAPKLREVRFQHFGAPADAGTKREGNQQIEVAPEVGKRLWPQVVACIRALGQDHPQRAWVRSIANWVLPAVGPAAVPELLGLLDDGLGADLQDWLPGFVTAENAVAVLSRYERFGDWKQRSQFLGYLRADLPPMAFPVLRDKAELQRKETPGEDLSAFAWAMVRTGRPEVADWISAEWQRRPVDAKWAVTSLLALGRRTQDEKVRVAMRTLLQEGRATNSKDLLLALLSMHDLPTLQSEFLLHSIRVNMSHPYGPKGTGVSVADYLFAADPQPPHGFTEDELSELLVRLAAAKLIYDAFSWQDLAKIAPRLHGEAVRLQMLATQPRVPGAPIDPGGNSPDNVRQMLAGTVLQRTRTPEGQGSALHGWAATMLREPRADLREAVLTQLQQNELEPHRALLESFVDGDDQDLAVCAVRKLNATSSPLEPVRLAKNRHPGVRRLAVKQWGALGKDDGEDVLLSMLRDPDAEVRKVTAELFGARVSKAAVPDLIALLRDPIENVRAAAADALTRIRFFHEQQAHWERVLKGLDASPASAAEKLLLQAKPGAPKAQRLLAITSLGTLGVPEALPFLIEWTADADAEIAAAAKASITQIHLNPRK